MATFDRYNCKDGRASYTCVGIMIDNQRRDEFSGWSLMQQPLSQKGEDDVQRKTWRRHKLGTKETALPETKTCTEKWWFRNYFPFRARPFCSGTFTVSFISSVNGPQKLVHPQNPQKLLHPQNLTYGTFWNDGETKSGSSPGSPYCLVASSRSISRGFHLQLGVFVSLGVKHMSRLPWPCHLKGTWGSLKKRMVPKLNLKDFLWKGSLGPTKESDLVNEESGIPGFMSVPILKHLSRLKKARGVYLGGGFKDFLCSSLLGEIIQID